MLQLDDEAAACLGRGRAELRVAQIDALGPLLAQRSEAADAALIAAAAR